MMVVWFQMGEFQDLPSVECWQDFWQENFSSTEHEFIVRIRKNPIDISSSRIGTITVVEMYACVMYTLHSKFSWHLIDSACFVFVSPTTIMVSKESIINVRERKEQQSRVWTTKGFTLVYSSLKLDPRELPFTTVLLKFTPYSQVSQKEKKKKFIIALRNLTWVSTLQEA